MVNQERARALGLNAQDISQVLQTLISGFTVTTMREGIEQVGIVAHAAQAERLSLGRLSDLAVMSRNGLAVPVAQVARLE